MTAGSDNSQEGTETRPRLGPAEQMLEVGIILFLILPSAISYLFSGWAAALTFNQAAFSVIMHQLAVVGVIWLLLRRNGESVGQIGWTLGNWGRELGLGALLFIPYAVGGRIFMGILYLLGLSSQTIRIPAFWIPRGPAQIVLALVLLAVVAATEETIFRGYLLLRLTAVTRNLAVAVAVSTVIFSLIHAYQGLAGMIGAAFAGLLFALVYIWRRSLVAPIILHFLGGFVAIVLPRVLALR